MSGAPKINPNAVRTTEYGATVVDPVELLNNSKVRESYAAYEQAFKLREAVEQAMRALANVDPGVFRNRLAELGEDQARQIQQGAQRLQDILAPLREQAQRVEQLTQPARDQARRLQDILAPLQDRANQINASLEDFLNRSSGKR